MKWQRLLIPLLLFFSHCVFSQTNDMDKDGVPDAEDLCPGTAGTLANKGCPVQDFELSEQDKSLLLKNFQFIIQQIPGKFEKLKTGEANVDMEQRITWYKSQTTLFPNSQLQRKEHLSYGSFNGKPSIAYYDIVNLNVNAIVDLLKATLKDKGMVEVTPKYLDNDPAARAFRSKDACLLLTYLPDKNIATIVIGKIPYLYDSDVKPLTTVKKPVVAIPVTTTTNTTPNKTEKTKEKVKENEGDWEDEDFDALAEAAGKLKKSVENLAAEKQNTKASNTFIEVSNLNYENVKNYKNIHKGKYYIKTTGKLTQIDFETGSSKEIKIPFTDSDNTAFTDNYFYYTVHQNGYYVVHRMDLDTQKDEIIEVEGKYELKVNNTSVRNQAYNFGFIEGKTDIQFLHQYLIITNDGGFASSTKNFVVLDNESKARLVDIAYSNRKTSNSSIEYSGPLRKACFANNKVLSMYHSGPKYHEVVFGEYKAATNRYDNANSFPLEDKTVKMQDVFLAQTGMYFIMDTYDDATDKIIKKTIYKFNEPKINQLAEVKVMGDTEFKDATLLGDDFYITTTKKTYQYNIKNKTINLLKELPSNTVYTAMCRDDGEPNQKSYFTKIKDGVIVATKKDKGLPAEKEEFAFIKQTASETYSYYPLTEYFANSIVKPDFSAKSCGYFYDHGNGTFYVCKDANKNYLLYKLDFVNKTAIQVFPPDFGNDKFSSIKEVNVVGKSLFFKTEYSNGANKLEKVLKYCIE